MSHFLSQAEHDMSGYATDLGKSQTAYGVPRSQPSGVRRSGPSSAPTDGVKVVQS
jgi:hypothetical protein